MHLLLICLLCICRSSRIKKDSSLPPRLYAQFASRAEQRVATKTIAWRSRLFATHALPEVATQSRLSHAPNDPGPFVPSDDKLDKRLEAQSQAITQWPKKPWWPKGGQTVRHLDTGEEFVIETFFRASGQKVVRCRSMRDNRIAFLKPEQVSDELAQPDISPHDGEVTNGQWPSANTKGRPFKKDDDVIIGAVRGIRKARRGQITMFRPATSRGTDDHIDDGLDLTVRVDYVLNGVDCHVWCDPLELQHTPWPVSAESHILSQPVSPPGPF